ncbi:MAG: glycosyltransferase family 4 protein, partial [Nanoarchaeota archaeon]|nr:glycosyltransferase family 4 protein [Nanoarchaeota archaeon]
MKILNISLEKKLFLVESKAQQRVLDYARLFERFDLIVLTPRGYKNIEFENMIIAPTNSFIRFFYLVDAYFWGKKIIKKYGYDVVSAQDPFEMGLIAWLLVKKYKLKLQIQIHGDYFSSLYWRKESFLNRLRFYLGKFIIKKADSVRVVSHRIKESLIKLGLAPEKIVVVPIYSPIDNENLIIKNKKEDNKFIFLTVGRLVNVKNISLQIQAMVEIIKNYPNIELWIVGDGPEKNKLENLSKKLKIEKNVKFFGWQDNLEKFYQQADVFLFTSNYEGWGMVIIEAASFGLPIIMTDAGCAGEVIKNEENGLVIEVNNKKALVTAMIKFIENKDFGIKIGEEA